MQVTYTEFWEEPFEVGTEKLKNVIELLPPNFELSNIDVECTDNFEREFKDLDELSNYRNHKEKAISQINLRFRNAESSTYSKSAGFLRIGKGDHLLISHLAQIQLELTGEESLIESLKQKISAEFSTWLPQNRWLYKSWKTVKYKFILLPFFSLLVIFVTLHMSGISNVVDLESTNSYSQMVVLLSVISITLLLTLIISSIISSIIDYIQAKFFPTATFLIGEGYVRAQKLKAIRKWIMYLLIGSVPLLAGLLIS